MNAPQGVLEHWQHDPWDDPDQTDALFVERPKRERRGWRWLLLALAIVVVAAVIAAGVVGYWYAGKMVPAASGSERITFTVNKKDTLESVTARLAQQGLITDEAVFKWYVERHGGLKLTEGYYRLPRGAHMGSIMGALATPPAETFTRLTFPEGYTIVKMAARLAKDLPTMNAAAFEQAALRAGQIRSKFSPPGVTSLEGLLFPDTYQVSNADTETRVINRMRALMERVAGQLRIEERSAALGITPYQALIIASMVEREAKTAADRPKIARVIYNRLFLKMKLQVDATLWYGQDPKAPFDVVKAKDSPYNTYLHEGLPPTPIANPGRASIEAALNPAPNPGQNDSLCKDLGKDQPCAYLYYVLADEVGNHAFAVTLAQHEANIAKARDAGVLK